MKLWRFSKQNPKIGNRVLNHSVTLIYVCVFMSINVYILSCYLIIECQISSAMICIRTILANMFQIIQKLTYPDMVLLFTVGGVLLRVETHKNTFGMVIDIFLTSLENSR